MFGKNKHIDKVIAMLESIGKGIAKPLKESGELKSEAKPDPLLGFILKAQTLDELKEIQAKYQGSIGIAHSLALICQEFEIRLKNLEERMSEMEKKMEKGDK